MNNDALIPLLDQAEEVITQRFAALVAVKTIGQVTKRYGDELTNAVYDVWNGNSDAIDFRRIHKALLREFAPQVFDEGMREGGIDEPDEEDQQVADEKVSDWLSTQIPEVNNFAKDIAAAAKDKSLRDGILSRVDMWIESMRNLGDQGKGYANGNKKGQWILGETEKHCDTCLKLSKMKQHRVSWFTDRGYIPRENGSESLDCGGWKCDCSIVDSEGNQLL